MGKTINLWICIILLLGLFSTAAASDREPVPLPEAIESLRLDTTLTVDGVSAIQGMNLGVKAGPARVVVYLEGDSVADLYAFQLDRSSGAITQDDLLQQQALLRSLKRTQDQFVGNAMELDPGLQVLVTLQRLVNAVFIEIDASVVDALAQVEGVAAIFPLIDYGLYLHETVPYIGASNLHSAGYTGEGVRVALIDSGIDYTHAALGGSGNPQDFTQNDPAVIEPMTFPTAKVIGGYDFVGGAWPSGSLMPDPDPLDAGPNRGHGTHVAHILAGIGNPERGIYPGVAPGAHLYALKACSSVTDDCSGLGLIQSMDFAVDPNGDGKLDDAVDIINLSAGMDYGDPSHDNLAYAIDKAAEIGILTVVPGGNGGDRPYVTGSPSNAPAALSVAATHVPSAVLPLMQVVSPDTIAGFYAAVWQDWSAGLEDVYPTGIEGNLAYGDGQGNNLDGCQPFTPGSLQDLIVLVDRGNCPFSTKLNHIEAGGGTLAIFGLTSPGEPFNSSNGGAGQPGIPGYMISLPDAAALKSALPGVVMRFAPGMGTHLEGVVAGYSSRGPGSWMNIIKPEIAAPDASISAVAGSGVGVALFGGTSGAAPIVAGSAALLKESLLETSGLYTADPQFPLILKSMLVNNAEPDILAAPDLIGGEPAPITRIGGGEIRVDRSIAAPIVTWVSGIQGLNSPTLSFGLVDITQSEVIIDKVVQVHNLTEMDLYFGLTASHRSPGELTGSIVGLTLIPQVLHVPKADGEQAPEATFTVRITIDGSKLQEWTMNSGVWGADGDVLSANEYGGYVWLDDLNSTGDDDRKIHIPWHILPRLSGDINSDKDTVVIEDIFNGFPSGSFELENQAAGPGFVNAYSWIYHSPNLSHENSNGISPVVVDIKDVGIATYPVQAGYCSGQESFVMAVAITTYDRYTHLVPNPLFEVLLDVDLDGVADFDVFNFDASLEKSLSDGRSVTWVANLESDEATGYFFTNHATNSSNTVLTFCAEQIGMSGDNYGAINLSVLASDRFYAGMVTDQTSIIALAPFGERYTAQGEDLAPNSAEEWRVLDLGGTNTGDLGILLLLDATRKTGVRSGATDGKESLTLFVSPKLER